MKGVLKSTFPGKNNFLKNIFSAILAKNASHVEIFV
jgi:hypothetical protein